MKSTLLKAFALATVLGITIHFDQAAGQSTVRPQTFCNPLDLAYRFQLEAPSRREAADPALIKFKGEYWLFASKSGGYWHSRDMDHWTFIEPTGLPLEDYAPAVEVLNGQLLYTAFGTRALYGTDDPAKGVWKKVTDLEGYPDPDIFLDEDGRFFVYFGCHPAGPIQVVELDPKHDFKVIHGPINCLTADCAHHGWENKGDDNLSYPQGTHNLPYIEGAWMTKHAGIYYLQYSAPGTEVRTYADGVYTSTNPLGPFVYAPYSPFSHKPTGFAAGAGHSSMMQYDSGQYWHVSTMPISVRHIFERRLGLFPAGFTQDGQMFCNTYLGDYPQFVPGSHAQAEENNSPGWMLLSYHKLATASSTLEHFPVENAFDENIRTWWSAATGKAGEWLQVDLGKPCRIDSMQINFADQGMTNLGRMYNDSYRYYVETSADGKSWETNVDRSDNLRDAPHDYVELDQPVTNQYVRLVNVHFPGGGLFSVSGLRVFGNGLGQAPEVVNGVKATRDASDRRKVHVSWSPVTNADFYIIRYGIGRDRLFNNYQVYQATHFDINSLNTGTSYYLTVDAVNDSGVTQGARVLNVK